MARANRHFIPGQVWHITHRCHKKQWLLKFARDKKRWMYWLFEARRRYGLVVLNFIVTSNHIHLLVVDQGRGEIWRSMQLIAGRTAQEYNKRKGRAGAFWQDRYHSTAIQSNNHLQRCITYIDLNMVRAGVIQHPTQWPYSGYAETISPRSRYQRLDISYLHKLFNSENSDNHLIQRTEWIEIELRSDLLNRNPIWTEAVAVGDRAYIDSVQAHLKSNNPSRKVIVGQRECVLQEPTNSLYRVFS